MIISPELFQQFIFYLFATFTVGSAMAVVTVKNTIYSALFLVLCFFNTAVLWLLIEAEFLAITLKHGSVIKEIKITLCDFSKYNCLLNRTKTSTKS